MFGLVIWTSVIAATGASAVAMAYQCVTFGLLPTGAMKMTLRDKLAALTAPCREADAEIAVMLQVLPANLQHIDDGLTVHPDTACPHLIEIQTAEGGYVGGFAAISFTASLDATVKLVERELPGAYTFLHNELGEGEDGPIWTGYTFGHDGRHTLPAVALLLALVDAKGIE